MATLIRNRRIVASWSPPSEAEARALRERGEVLLLEPDADLAAVTHRLPHVLRIEVNFPKFGDGRGYSIARLLRERYGYRGELRAVGEVVKDHLLYMESVGFDSFLLRDGEDAVDALEGFEVFSEAYQTSVTRPLPLFRRRAA